MTRIKHDGPYGKAELLKQVSGHLLAASWRTIFAVGGCFLGGLFGLGDRHTAIRRVHVNDDTVRIFQRKDFVFLHGKEIENHAGGVLAVLAGANGAQNAVGNRGCRLDVMPEPGTGQIDIKTMRTTHGRIGIKHLIAVFDTAIQFENHTGVVVAGLVADHVEMRQTGGILVHAVAIGLFRGRFGF